MKLTQTHLDNTLKLLWKYRSKGIFIYLLMAVCIAVVLVYFFQTKETTLEKNLEGKVVEVVDGDTIKVDISGTNETVRLVGIDTPEKNHPQKPVECFAIEASEETKRLIFGQHISLELDGLQPDRDAYGRLLAYVYFQNDSNEKVDLNKYLVENGFAFVYRDIKSDRYDEFKNLEDTARIKELGLWGDKCSNA